MSTIKNEFQKKYLYFDGISPETFYHSKWFKQRRLFVLYRATLFAYCLAWAVIDRVFYSKHYPTSLAVGYLSNWAEWIQTSNFGVFFLVSLYGLVVKKSSSADLKQAKDVAQTALKRGDCGSPEQSQENLRCFHKLCWLLFSMSPAIQFLVTLLYWTAVSEEVLSMAIVIHQHAVNSVLASLDLMMSGIPIRLLHFVYMPALGIFYMCVTLLLHVMGKQSVFYEGVLDWKTYPVTSVVVCLGSTLIAVPILHFIVYLLYLLREKIAKITQNSRRQNVNENAAGNSLVESGSICLNESEENGERRL